MGRYLINTNIVIKQHNKWTYVCACGWLLKVILYQQIGKKDCYHIADVAFQVGFQELCLQNFERNDGVKNWELFWHFEVI